MEKQIKSEKQVNYYKILLNVWVFVRGYDVTVLQPDNIRNRIANGFNSQLNQSTLFNTDVS